MSHPTQTAGEPLLHEHALVVHGSFGCRGRASPVLCPRLIPDLVWGGPGASREEHTRPGYDTHLSAMRPKHDDNPDFERTEWWAHSGGKLR